MLVLLALLLMAMLSYVLYTESGSRWAINYAIKQSEQNIEFKRVTGTLAHGLTFSKLQYKEDSLNINIGMMAFEFEWSWFDRHVKISEATVNEVSILQDQTKPKSAKPEPFQGVTLPVTVDLVALKAENIAFKNTDGAVDEFISTINLSAQVAKQSATINMLQVDTTGFGLLTSGQLQFGDGIAFNADTQWQFNSVSDTFTGKGVVTGGLSEIEFEQDITVAGDLLNGKFDASGVLGLAADEPVVSLWVNGPLATLWVAEEKLIIEQFKAEITGALSDYQVQVHGMIGHAQIPTSQFSFNAVGDAENLSTQNAQLMTPEGRLGIEADLSWQQGLQAKSQISFDAFNPQQLLPAWPGQIDGSLLVDLDMSDELIVSARKIQLKGLLKNDPLAITGSAAYANGAIETEQLNLEWANNQVALNGQLTEQAVDLSMELVWPNLSLLLPDASGELFGTLKFSGDYLNPRIEANLQGRALLYQNIQAQTISIESVGVWTEALTTRAVFQNASISDREFDEISITQQGNLQSHQMDLKLVTEELSSSISLQGSYQTMRDKTNPNPRPRDWQWSGQLVSHEVLLKNGKSVMLQKPININIADVVSIQAACWQGVEAGTLCVEFNDYTQSDQTLQGSISLESFSLAPLYMLLPENLKLTGYVNGDAKFNLQDDVLHVQSELKLIDGNLMIQNQQAVMYQQVIESLTIKATTMNEEVGVDLEGKLADGSFVSLAGQIILNKAGQWVIDSNLEGEIKDTSFLAQLSSELSEVKGQLQFNGDVSGEVIQPAVNLIVSQPQGHVKLTRLGTLIEQLNLQIKSQGLRQPIYQISLTGANVESLNQGHISSTGTLSLLGGRWQYQGQVNGSNFMVLNLPELKFNVSPNMAIQANQTGMNLVGELLIDYGHVVIKQLPPSTISNSPDLQIHTENNEPSAVYPINMEINASIKDSIDLDVIGLNADLSGSIVLKQTNNQGMQGNGVLNLSDGTYEIYGQKLNITEGELTFNGPLDNPRLNVSASRPSLAGDVTAGVQLGGTVNNLQSSLFSEPNLPDIEKLSYIMSGRGSDSAADISGQQLKQAAVVLGLKQSSPIFNQLQNQFGIDVLTVKESAYAKDTVVEAGKKINDKLYVSYNQGLFNRLGFWVMKYRINQFLNLQTTQGEDQSIELVYTRKATNKKATTDPEK